jgi:hypothetical protein
LQREYGNLVEAEVTLEEVATAATRAQKRWLPAALREHALAATGEPTTNSNTTDIPTPKHYGQARRSTESARWKEAEDSEWDGLWAKGCFTEEPITDQKLHHLMWNYKIKSTGKLKARLVLDGRRQDPSTYGDIRSPTMRLTSMRILLAVSAQRSWPIYADDASHAFINTKRPESSPMWAAMPAGRKKPGRCLRIRRFLYGTHDAPKAWYDNVRAHVTGPEQNLKQSRCDECCFYGKDIMVVLHVDDFLITGKPDVVKEFRRKLYARYDMTGGVATEYYGLDIDQKLNSADDRRISISAKGYIERAVRKLQFQPRRVETPMDPEIKLPKLPGECPDSDSALHSRYRTLVGTCQHASTTCRPDISASVRALAVHLQHPGQVHLQAAERLLSYLWTTKHYALQYVGKGPTSAPIATTFYGTT